MKKRPELTRAMTNGIRGVIAMAEEREHNALVRRGVAALRVLIQWQETHGAEARKRERNMLALLKAAGSALHDEVDAAGDLDHPIIRAHARLADRIDRFLKNDPS